MAEWLDTISTHWFWLSLGLVLGVADNLLRTHGSGRLTLELVEHYLPAPDEVLSGTVEPDLVTPLGTYQTVEAGR